MDKNKASRNTTAPTNLHFILCLLYFAERCFKKGYSNSFPAKLSVTPYPLVSGGAPATCDAAPTLIAGRTNLSACLLPLAWVVPGFLPNIRIHYAIILQMFAKTCNTRLNWAQKSRSDAESLKKITATFTDRH
jgi:hypothetical protein